MARKTLKFALISKIFRRFSTKPYILGIETSCDDTGVAIVDGNGRICGECVKSQQHYTSRFGGVIPYVAQKQHMMNLEPATAECFKQSGLTLTDIDAVALTIKPGIVMSLKAGAEYALRLCKQAKKPLVTVHHMKAHALTARWTDGVTYPYMCLLISGGHAIITWVKSVDDFVIIGQNLDNAPGEVLDKAARRLKLYNLSSDYANMSGGALLEKMARDGDPFAVEFATSVDIKSSDCNFQFGAIKGSFLKNVNQWEEQQSIVGGAVLPNYADICASVQYAVLRHLSSKLKRAFEYVKRLRWVSGSDDYPKTLVLSGGVAANTYFRNGLEYLASNFDCKLVCPPQRLCTDNGVMIAWNGLEKFLANIDVVQQIPDSIYVYAKWPLGEDMTRDVKLRQIKGREYRHLRRIDMKKDFNIKQIADCKMSDLCEKEEIIDEEDEDNVVLSKNR